MDDMGTIIGAQMDNYRVIEKIGEGGMGAVYRAVDVMLERDVALKFLRPELSREPELVQRFRAEAVLLARLNHHFIAPIFGLHRYGEELFIAMEYVPGETLDARLKRIERFSPDAAMHVTSMVLQALDYAHRLGVIHRDIKPGNVILTPSGTVKVMDFGIARVLGAERRTRAGAIVGTIAYMAPEQIQGHDTDQRADLYSVGTLLYEMLTGHVPFQADTDWALMQAQIATAPQPLRNEVEVPEALEAAVLRALEKTPEKRYQNAAEFQLALELVARHPDLLGADGVALAPGALTLPGALPSRMTGLPHVASWEETRVGLPSPPSGAQHPVPPPPTMPSGSHAAAPSADMTRLAAPSTPPPPAESPSAPTVLSQPGTPTVAPPPMPPSTPTVLSHPPAPPVAPAPVAPVAAAPAAVPRAQAKPPAPGPKKDTPTGLLVGVAVLLLALAGGGFFWWQRSQPTETAAVATDPAMPSPVDATTSQPPSDAPGTEAPAVPAGPAGTTGATPAPGTVRPNPAAPATDPTKKGQPLTTVAPPVPLPPTSPQPPPPRATPAAPAADESSDVQVFKDIRLVRRGGPELDIELHFGPSSLSVTNQGGRVVLHSMPYGNIASAEYHESRHRRMLVRTTRHWLLVKGPNGGGVLLRLERDGVKPLLAAFEQRWGHPVQMLAPEQEKEEK